jgi:hypothetical protein
MARPTPARLYLPPAQAGKTHDGMMTAIEQAFGSLTPLLQEYGVVAVMIILMLESIGLPLPGESLLILASVLAARGDCRFRPFSFWRGPAPSSATISAM